MATLPQYQTTTVGGPVPLSGAINGNQFVAQPTPGQQGPGAGQVVNQLWQQAGGTAYRTPSLDSTVGIVNNTMAGILNPNNAYIDSARRAGLEHAAARGGLNSSIAAGASQRAAIDSAMPMFQQALGLTSQRESQDFQGQQADQQRALQRMQSATGLQSQREQLGWQGQQAGLDRVQNVNNQLLQQQLRERQSQMDFENTRALQGDRVSQENWLADQNYSRQFNGNLALMPIQNSMQMNQAILDYALQNPEVYSPEVISGLQNFFTGTMVSILQQYFPNATRNGGNS